MSFLAPKSNYAQTNQTVLATLIVGIRTLTHSVLRPLRCVLLISSIVLFVMSPQSAFAGIFDIFGSGSKSDLKVLSVLDKSNGSPRGLGRVTVHGSDLVAIFSKDSGQGDGGFTFYDINDPTHPRARLTLQNEQTAPIREAHGYGFYKTDEGRDLVSLQTIDGIQIWDWTDHSQPRLLSHLKLPGIERTDYSTGAWWSFWQAPYIYVGGSGNGLYIVDAHDPKNPKLAQRAHGPNPIPPSQLGGFRIGPVYAVGSLMVISSMDQPGYATIDIANPLEPHLIAAETRRSPSIYSMHFTGGYILGAGGDSEFFVHDVRNPRKIVELDSIDLPDKGGYVTYQDGFAHVGSSKAYVKIDMRDPKRLRQTLQATSGIWTRDEDFASVIGNLVVVSDDHGVGNAIFQHDPSADRTPPQVNFISPAFDAGDVSLTTSIGMTFTDEINPVSATPTSIVVRSSDGATVNGYISSQMGVVNFSPRQPLKSNSVYEVILVAGGLTDLVGNPAVENPAYEKVVGRFRTVRDGSAKGEGCVFQAAAPSETSKSVILEVQKVLPQAFVSWNFGDGQSTGPTKGLVTVAHQYKKAGRYTVQVTVTDSTSQESIQTTCVGIQRIHNPLTPLKPAHSTPVILIEDLDRAIVVNPDSDSITIFAVDTLKKIAEVNTGKTPRTLTVGQDQEIWVANEGSANLTIIGGRTGKIIESIPLPHASQPFAVVASPDQRFIYVTLRATGELLKVDAKSHRLVRRKQVGWNPKTIAISSDSQRIYVARFISPSTGGEIWEVDSETLEIRNKHLLAIDQTPDTEDRGRGLPNYLGHMSISPDGARLWVPSKKDNILRGLTRDGKPLTFENSVRTIVSQIDLKAKIEAIKARRDLNDRDMANAVDFSPIGDLAFVAVQGSNLVDVLDTSTGALVTSIENTGLAPQGLAIDSSGKKIFIHNFTSQTLSVYDISEITNAGTNRAKLLTKIPSVENDKLSEQVRLGKAIFYNAKDPRMSRDGYISCASCHADGRDDGRVWDFTDRGEGLRNTISLAGTAGVGHGPLHWSANFDEVQDFENDIRNAFGGTGFMKDCDFNASTRSQTLGEKKTGFSRELDALAAYVTSLSTFAQSPWQNQDGTMTFSALQGQKVFQKLNCAECHGGLNYTYSALDRLSDVGTMTSSSGKRMGQPLKGLDIPTLRGLWDTAPYLHDGSAATISGALKHGGAQALSEQDRKDLERFLIELD